MKTKLIGDCFQPAYIIGLCMHNSGGPKRPRCVAHYCWGLSRKIRIYSLQRVRDIISLSVCSRFLCKADERTFPCAPVPSSQGEPSPRMHIAMSPYVRPVGNASSVPSTPSEVSGLRKACAPTLIALSRSLRRSQTRGNTAMKEPIKARCAPVTRQHVCLINTGHNPDWT